MAGCRWNRASDLTLWSWLEKTESVYMKASSQSVARYKYPRPSRAAQISSRSPTPDPVPGVYYPSIARQCARDCASNVRLKLSLTLSDSPTSAHTKLRAVKAIVPAIRNNPA